MAEVEIGRGLFSGQVERVLWCVAIAVIENKGRVCVDGVTVGVAQEESQATGDVPLRLDLESVVDRVAGRVGVDKILREQRAPPCKAVVQVWLIRIGGARQPEAA